MIWKSDLSVLVRITRIICLMIVISWGVPVALAASVPVTVEEDYDNLPEPQNTILAPIRAIISPLVDAERNTCDPEFWEVMKDRAWQEGQREITQNNNIINRPDSVLSMTCFGSFVNHLTRYSDRFFPGNPQESVGQMTGGLIGDALRNLAGEFTDLAVITPDEVFYNLSIITDPFGAGLGTDGFLMYAVLEMLVLDQLVDNVYNSMQNNIMRAADTYEMLMFANNGYDVIKLAALAACGVTSGSLGVKEYYIDDNFPDSMFGNRASLPVNTAPVANPVVKATISSGLPRQASRDSYSCNRMNQIWQAAKCYDMLAESSMFGVTPDHDGFYSLEQYRDEAAAGRDFRTRETMCDAPPSDNDPGSPSAQGVSCSIAYHGLPNLSFPNPEDPLAVVSFGSWLGVITGLWGINPIPNWDSASAGANPVAGAAGGVDTYMHFLGLRDSTSCSSIDPIKTGYIVNAPNGDRYVDAVCPAPGCYFNPPATIAGNGSCN